MAACCVVQTTCEYGYPCVSGNSREMLPETASARTRNCRSLSMVESLPLPSIDKAVGRPRSRTFVLTAP
eukprot:1859595-Rhodomonas_salina.2